MTYSENQQIEPIEKRGLYPRNVATRRNCPQYGIEYDPRRRNHFRPINAGSNGGLLKLSELLETGSACYSYAKSAEKERVVKTIFSELSFPKIRCNTNVEMDSKR